MKKPSKNKKKIANIILSYSTDNALKIRREKPQNPSETDFESHSYSTLSKNAFATKYLVASIKKYDFCFCCQQQKAGVAK